MLSWNSPADLKIVGIEGHTPDTLREEVSRGAKFVIYQYNFSLVVMSFKRPTNIYFLRPGRNRVVKGLPFTLISLVFGWWGIPWGVIYTIESLYTNLSGGTDVTHNILASLAPAPPPVPGSPAPRDIPAAPPTRPAISFKSVAAVVGVIAGTLLAVLAGICLYRGQNLPVALVAGTSKAYTVEVNGESHTLTPGRPLVLKQAHGEFVVRGAPSAPGELRFTAQVPFWSRLADQRVLVINPDAIGLVYRETVKYHTSDSSADPNETANFSLLINRAFHFVPAPDYFFEEFPANLSMPSGTHVVEKTRLTALGAVELDARLNLVMDKGGGYDAVRDHLLALARVGPADEALAMRVDHHLKPADARRVFESQLGRRPIAVDWHRGYEYLMDRAFPEVDLRDYYQGVVGLEPENGEALYLLARLYKNPAESHPLYERAQRTRQPSAYASYALATDAFAAGRYAEALAGLEQAEARGLNSASFRLRKRDTLLALGRTDAVLHQLHAEREKAPADTELFINELQLNQALHPDRVAGEKANAAFLATLRQRRGRDADLKAYEHYLAGRLLYSLGQERECAAEMAQVSEEMSSFEAAIERHDHAAAARIATNLKYPSADLDWILLLTAHDAHDAAAVEKYYRAALAKLAGASSYDRDNVRHLASDTPASHEKVRQLTPAFADELRVMFTALGVRFPAEREAYFARARELDRNPSFPHLLLQSVRADPGTQKL